MEPPHVGCYVLSSTPSPLRHGKQSPSKLMRQRDHLSSFLRRQLAVRVELPQPQPVLKVFGLQSQREMRSGESTAITRRSTSLQRPEFGDFVEVRGPILDVLVEDRPQHRVLTHVDVERLEELQNAFMAAETFVEGSWLAHKLGEIFVPAKMEVTLEAV